MDYIVDRNDKSLDYKIDRTLTRFDVMKKLCVHDEVATGILKKFGVKFSRYYVISESRLDTLIEIGAIRKYVASREWTRKRDRSSNK